MAERVAAEPISQRRASPRSEVRFELVIGAPRSSGRVLDDPVCQRCRANLDSHVYPAGRRTMDSRLRICARDSARSGSASCCSSARRLYTSSSRFRVRPASHCSPTSSRASSTDAGVQQQPRLPASDPQYAAPGPGPYGRLRQTPQCRGDGWAHAGSRANPRSPVMLWAAALCRPVVDPTRRVVVFVVGRACRMADGSCFPREGGP